VSTAMVFLLIPPHVVFDFPLFPTLASEYLVSYFGMAGVQLVADPRNLDWRFFSWCRGGYIGDFSLP